MKHFEGMNIFAETRDDALSLLQKMLASSGQNVEKTGTNTEQNYKYTEEAEVVRVTASAHRNGLLITFVPASQVENLEVGKTRYQNPIFETRIAQDIIVTDTTTGAYYRVTFPGSARDAGDKGVYKALTGAKKYALMETFHISTGADPESGGGGVPGEEGGGNRNDGGGGNRNDGNRNRNRNQRGGGVQRKTEAGTVTQKQLDDIDNLIASVTDLSAELVQVCIGEVRKQMGVSAARKDLSEEQGAKFINLFQQEVRKARAAHKEPTA